MGLRGPAPKPTAVEIFEGRPGRRPINPLEPRPPEFGPDAAKKACPKHLNAEEKKHWRHYAPILARMRVLTEADLMALEQLCVLSAQWVELMEMRRKSGLRAHFAKTPNGFTIVSPLMTEIHGHRSQLLPGNPVALERPARVRHDAFREDSHQHGGRFQFLSSWKSTWAVERPMAS